MEVFGKIIEELGERSGTSQNGTEWKIASYLLEIPGFNTTKMVFDVSDGLNGRINTLHIKKGERLRVYFDIDAHEYNGRWFNSIRAYGVKRETEEEQ